MTNKDLLNLLLSRKDNHSAITDVKMAQKTSGMPSNLNFHFGTGWYEKVENPCLLNIYFFIFYFFTKLGALWGRRFTHDNPLTSWVSSYLSNYINLNKNVICEINWPCGANCAKICLVSEFNVPGRPSRPGSPADPGSPEVPFSPGLPGWPNTQTRETAHLTRKQAACSTLHYLVNLMRRLSLKSDLGTRCSHGLLWLLAIQVSQAFPLDPSHLYPHVVLETLAGQSDPVTEIKQ